MWTGKKKFLAGVTSLFGKQTKIGTFTQYHNLDVAREIQSQACSADVKDGPRTLDGAIQVLLPRQKKSAIGKWEQSLDSLAHEIVVRRDKCCQKCGHKFAASDSKWLRREVHHLFGRGKSVRWLTKAQASLCLLCHDYLTQNPEAAKLWAQKWLSCGALFDQLDILSHRPVPVTIGFLETTELCLRNELKELKR